MAAESPGSQAPATVSSPARVSNLLRSDGSLITWYLDRPPGRGYPLAVIIQGSECLPVAGRYAEIRAALVAHGIGVLRVEKRGLQADTTTCPDEYLRENTIPSRILDYLDVIAALRQTPDGWNVRLVIVGGSEGGLIAALLAPLSSHRPRPYGAPRGQSCPPRRALRVTRSRPFLSVILPSIQAGALPSKCWGE